MGASSQTSPADWPDAVLIATAFASDPTGLAGVRIRGPSGPTRDQWLELVRDLLPVDTAMRRCPVLIDEERLLGGLDLTASLATGTSVVQRGLLSESHGGIVVFAMAEGLPTGIGAQIAQVIDQGHVQIARDGINLIQDVEFGMILLDEGATDDERPPSALIERCAFHIETQALAKVTDAPSRSDVAAARGILRTVMPIDDEIQEALTQAAFAFGIDSFRPVLFALRVARCVAALSGRKEVTFDDANIAARLVLSAKATRLPESQVEPENEVSPTDTPQEGHEPQHEQTSSENTPAPPTPEPQSSPSASGPPPSDILIETVKAALPAELIAALMNATGLIQRTRDRDGRGSGDSVASAKRGRPIGSRRGAIGGGQRIHLIDTLRAAAPWQKLRQQSLATAKLIENRILVRSEDIKVRRFIEKRETTIIFAVDASGSSAWQRLAEAKGAVQLMLARAYQTRSRVGLVAFRKDSAEIILPPTRSLARARRLLADMVGGGGTPLATGIEVALKLALDEKAKGRTARLLILTDGQGNVARDGSLGRGQANADALAMAHQVRLSGIQTVQIDTATRPRPESRDLAKKMGATYMPLPSARSGDLAALTALAP
jgi:magnesium chelatase subunit D